MAAFSSSAHQPRHWNPSGASQPRPSQAPGWDPHASSSASQLQNILIPENHPCDRLQNILLLKVSDDLVHFMTLAHRPAMKPRDDSRKRQMCGKSFSSTVNTLKRSYCAHLHETLDECYTEDMAASVRDLADTVKQKLLTNCSSDAAQLGAVAMKDMLTGLKDEFFWDIAAQVFEACAEIARTEKQAAYENAMDAEERLRHGRHC